MEFELSTPNGLNKGFSGKLCMGSWVWHETPEEGWRMHPPKHCKHNNEDEDNSSNKVIKIIKLNLRNLDIYIYIYIYIYIHTHKYIMDSFQSWCMRAEQFSSYTFRISWLQKNGAPMCDRFFRTTLLRFWIDWLVSSFNGLLTFVGHLMPKPS